MPDTLHRTPVYQQLNQLLRGLINSKDFAPASRFLTERQIAARFAVSRATANKAISNLIAEGVLEYRTGLGTYVRGNRLDNDLRQLVSFTAIAQAAGKTPETQVLDFDQLPAAEAGAEVAPALGCPADEPVVMMRRRRLADGQPLILEWRCIRQALVPGLTRADVAGSLYQLLTERYHFAIEGCDQAIAAINCDRDQAQQLETAMGAAGLQVRSVGYLGDGRPLWLERTLYRGDGYTFLNRLGRIPPAAHGAAVPTALQRW